MANSDVNILGILDAQFLGGGPVGMPPRPGGMPPQPGGMPPQPGGMPPQPGGMPGGMHPQPGMGGFPQQPSAGPGVGGARLDPDKMPSPIQVMDEDQRTYESNGGYFDTKDKGAPPPLVTTNFVTRDYGNASPRFMRSTMYYVPSSEDMRKQTGMKCINYFDISCLRFVSTLVFLSFINSINF